VADPIHQKSFSGAPPGSEIRLTGSPLSDGVVLARAHLLESAGSDAGPRYYIPPQSVGDEQQRLRHAFAAASDQLQALIEEVNRRIGPAQANIFIAQKMMVEDEELHKQIFRSIEERLMNAEAAVSDALDTYESMLHEVDDEYLQERASDIGEIRRRLLDILRNKDSRLSRINETLDTAEFHILAAEEITPGETVGLDTEHIVGFITERGGPVSHAAILARALGIPAVSGIRNFNRLIADGEEILLNGTTGEIILRPAEATRRLYPGARRSAAPRVHTVAPVSGVTVMANVNLRTELNMVKTVKAEGIGLYRTEFEFLAAGRNLTEDEQYDRYSGVRKVMEGQEVYFRLADFGADKKAAFMEIPAEDNPCLGFRGSRLLQQHPEIFIPQIRALARASIHGPVHVLYPMIIELDQFLVLRELFNQNVQDIERGEIYHGVMFEVPSACLEARRLFEAADFGCIGSNDLIQYLFAIDRNNERVAREYNPDKQVFWALLRDLVSAAKDAGRPLSLCGEISGQPQFLPRLLGCGIRRLSVTPRLIGLVRLTARRNLKH
jgi:phosphoenolpyruvate-protein phosphotransferase (PTS system enzyme I)